MYDATLSLLEGAALEALAHGTVPGPVGSMHRSIAPFGTFEARDGQLVICAGNDDMFLRACAGLGAPHLARDDRYRTNTLRMAHLGELIGDLEAVLATEDVAHWIAALDAVGVPSAPVSSVPEALGSPQAAHRRMVVTAGGLRLPGQVVKLSGYDDPDVRPAAPELDEHGPALREQFPPDRAESP
jgi:CoA:oxalate CoA-transferase